MHRLTSLDTEARTAHCEECGPTVVLFKSRKDRSGYWRCATIIRVERKRHRQTKDGLPRSARAARIAAQGGRCAICKREAKLVGDHCHKTKRARKLLCQRCNLMLGYALDDPVILQAAIDYLDEHDL